MQQIMQKICKQVALPASLALVFGMPLTTQAEQAQSQGEQKAMTDESGSTDLDQQTKKKFVDAYVQIKDVQQKYTNQLENVKDKQKARKLQEQAQSEMVQIVEQSEMTVKNYNKVVNAISKDAELRMEIEKMAKSESSQ